MDCIYFSFSTLTTTGFGDIAPLSDVAKTAFMVESIIGQLFLAILIAKLVGVYPAPASATRTAQAPPTLSPLRASAAQHRRLAPSDHVHPNSRPNDVPRIMLLVIIIGLLLVGSFWTLLPFLGGLAGRR